nr:hypothetical protein [Tanacetum cinerariifolium]
MHMRVSSLWSDVLGRQKKCQLGRITCGISDPKNLQTQKVLFSRKGEPLEINTQNFVAVKQAGQQAN